MIWTYMDYSSNRLFSRSGDFFRATGLAKLFELRSRRSGGRSSLSTPSFTAFRISIAWENHGKPIGKTMGMGRIKSAEQRKKPMFPQMFPQLRA